MELVRPWPETEGLCVSNCVTTHTNSGEQARTSADYQHRWEPPQPKREAVHKLLQDGEVIAQWPATPVLPTRPALTDVTGHRG
jgi:hypothetical protein